MRPPAAQGWTGHPGAIACALAALLASALLLRRWPPPVEHGLAAVAILLGAAAPLILLQGDGPFGTAGARDSGCSSPDGRCSSGSG